MAAGSVSARSPEQDDAGGGDTALLADADAGAVVWLLEDRTPHHPAPAGVPIPQGHGDVAAAGPPVTDVYVLGCPAEDLPPFLTAIKVCRVLAIMRA